MPKLSQIIKRFTDDTVLHWVNINDDPFGKPVYDVPVPIKARWEDREQDILLANGRTVRSKGYLLLSIPISTMDLIWLGTRAEWEAQSYYPTIPTVGQGAREILKVNRTPGIKQLPGNVYEAYF